MASANSGLPGNVISIINKFEESLNVACTRLLEETPSAENPEFDLDSFWIDLNGATKLVSHEASIFCMAFDGEIKDDAAHELLPLINKNEKNCLALLTVFFSLPKRKGNLLHKEIRLYVLSILEGMQRLCAAVKKCKSNRLKSVGNVWERCSAVENLPRDNREAVLHICQQQHDLVFDACQELVEALDHGAESSGMDLSFITPLNGIQIPPIQSWTPSDRNVLLPCLGLVKACKACIKKTLQAIEERGNGTREMEIAELDSIADIVKDSDSLVDDLVMSTYPPMDHSAVREQASLVRSNCKELLSTVKMSHFCTPADEVWIDFLNKAVDHNWVRINDLALAD